MSGTAAVFFRLVLILALVGNGIFALAAENVRQGRSSGHLSQSLEGGELTKVSRTLRIFYILQVEYYLTQIMLFIRSFYKILLDFFALFALSSKN